MDEQINHNTYSSIYVFLYPPQDSVQGLAFLENLVTIYWKEEKQEEVERNEGGKKERRMGGRKGEGKEARRKN